MKWGALQRLEFIEYRLFWEGRINRKDIIERFNVSIPQASTDIKNYKHEAPGNMRYNKRTKHYYASPSFKPVLRQLDVKSFFSQIQMLSDGIIEQNSSSLGYYPDYDVLYSIERVIDIKILQNIVLSMRDEMALKVQYQSMSRPVPIWRWISPHAFAYDGFRWHIRAFCEERNTFRDFIIGRIITIDGIKKRSADPSEDKKWHQFIKVEIAPHPSLTEGQKKIIEYEYGMENGKVDLTVRLALLYYLINRFKLENENLTRFNPQRNLIILNNEEIDSYIE